MCAVTIGERLPGKDDDDDDDDDVDDDDDAGDMSISDIAATDDEVAEILSKYISQLQHIICAEIHHILWEQFSTLDTTILGHICTCAWDKKTYDMIFALTIDTAYLVLMMMLMMMMIQVICQCVICKVQMMKFLKYSNNK